MDKQFYLLTLIQGSTILYGTHSVGQLLTRLGPCSCSGWPVRDETVSTFWVFDVTSIVLILILTFEWVNYFLNIDPPRKNYIQSKGKSNLCAKETFHNLILHTHFILNLQLIAFVLYYISLIHRATNEQTIVFCPDYFDKTLITNSPSAVSSTYLCKDCYWFHLRVSHIRWYYRH